MTINVTAKEIRNGKRKAPCKCPVALALMASTGSQWEVGATQLIRGGYWCYAPPDVWQFISDFDAGRPVEPFSFTLPEGAP